jgi:steroid delta-isomerase-like uncharacterized protein
VPVPTIGEGLTRRRERLVRDHVEAENGCDFDAALATFSHPRYEYVATDEVYDGAEAVMAHWRENERAFPDQLVEIMKLHSADDAVFMEAVARGTHTGPYRGLPPTGRRYELPFLGIFVFEGDKLVCERVYFDSGTMLQALGVAADPLSVRGRVGALVAHPLAIGRGAIRGVVGR